MKKEIRDRLEKFYAEHKEEVQERLKGKDAPKELHAVVQEIVDSEVKEFDFTDFITTTRRVNADDKVYLNVLGKVDVYTASSSSDVIRQVWSNSKYEIPRIPLVAQYRYNKQEINTGFLPAVEDMVDELSMQLRVEIQKTIVNVIRAATAGAYTINTNNANFATDLDNTIDNVLDNTLTGQCYIVGRRNMLRKVADLGASEATKEEKDKYGIIARYHDADLKPVPKVGRGQEALMNANELFVAAPDNGKFVYFGDVEEDEVKVDLFQVDMGMLQWIGFSIIPTLGRIYRIVLS